MPNVMSEHSRRVNFIWDKQAFADLEEIAAAKRMTVSELIRQTLEEKYAGEIHVPHPVIAIRQHTNLDHGPRRDQNHKTTVRKSAAARATRNVKPRRKKTTA